MATTARRRACGSTLLTNLSTLDLLVSVTGIFVRPRGRPDSPGVGTAEGNSSIGRASVSKTEGWGFKSLLPCRGRSNTRTTRREGLRVAKQDEGEPTDG